MPRFLDNLYRDMRDRRLLLPALALLVALIAVPVLLKSSPATPAPPAASAASSGAAGLTAAEPAVVTERVGVTDYRRRLDWFQSKNPFRTHVAPSSKAASRATSGSGGGASTTTTTSSTVTTSGNSSSTVSDTSTTTTSSSGSSSGSGPSHSGGGGSHTPPPPKWYSYRVAVSVGPAGDLTERNSVKRLVFLPGDNRPLAAFIGVSEDAKRAIFVVSHDVSSVRGDGRCIPRRGSCNYLELKPGDKASLQYAPERNRAYNLKLRGIELVPVRKLHGNVPRKRGASQDLLGPDG